MTVLVYLTKRSRIYASVLKDDAQRIKIKALKWCNDYMRSERLILSWSCFFSGACLEVIATIVLPNWLKKRKKRRPVQIQTNFSGEKNRSGAKKKKKKIRGRNVLTSAWWVSARFCARLQWDRLAPCPQSLSESATLALSLCPTAHISSSLMSNSEPSFSKLSSLKQRETTTVFHLFAFSPLEVLK